MQNTRSPSALKACNANAATQHTARACSEAKHSTRLRTTNETLAFTCYNLACNLAKALALCHAISNNIRHLVDIVAHIVIQAKRNTALNGRRNNGTEEGLTLAAIRTKKAQNLACRLTTIGTDNLSNGRRSLAKHLYSKTRTTKGVIASRKTTDCDVSNGTSTLEGQGVSHQTLAKTDDVSNSTSIIVRISTLCSNGLCLIIHVTLLTRHHSALI